MEAAWKQCWLTRRSSCRGRRACAWRLTSRAACATCTAKASCTAISRRRYVCWYRVWLLVWRRTNVRWLVCVLRPSTRRPTDDHWLRNVLQWLYCCGLVRRQVLSAFVTHALNKLVNMHWIGRVRMTWQLAKHARWRTSQLCGNCACMTHSKSDYGVIVSGSGMTSLFTQKCTMHAFLLCMYTYEYVSIANCRYMYI